MLSTRRATSAKLQLALLQKCFDPVGDPQVRRKGTEKDSTHAQPVTGVGFTWFPPGALRGRRRTPM